MPRIAYVNGRYLPHAAAGIHIEDRALQFSDGVYEVIAIRSGKLMDLEPHLERLARSLSELRIRPALKNESLKIIFSEIIRRNHLRDGIIYMQISRGIAPRDHAFPPQKTRPSLIVTAQRQDLSALQTRNAQGVGIITVPDLRWKRRDIKSVSLIGNVLAKQAAREAGAFEAWLVDEAGKVNEGASTNAWIVTAQGDILTPMAGNDILSGITRAVVLEVARAQKLKLIERFFTVEEAKKAREAFLTSTTALVLSVTKIDDTVIGDGRPGPLAKALYRALVARWIEQGMVPEKRV